MPPTYPSTVYCLHDNSDDQPHHRHNNNTTITARIFKNALKKSPNCRRRIPPPSPAPSRRAPPAVHCIGRHRAESPATVATVSAGALWRRFLRPPSTPAQY